MSTPIKITAGTITSRGAGRHGPGQAVAGKLPIETMPNEWGDEFYFRHPRPIGTRRDGNDQRQGRRHRLLAAGQRDGDLLRPHADELGRRPRPGERCLYARPDHRRCGLLRQAPGRPDDPDRKDLIQWPHLEPYPCLFIPEKDCHGASLSQIGIHLAYGAPEPLPARGAAIGSAREDPPDPLLGEGGKARLPSAD